VSFHSEKDKENPLPEHEADHTVIDVYNGSLHAQCNINFTSFFFFFNAFLCDSCHHSTLKYLHIVVQVTRLCGSARVSNL
jgi:hypothetical protein